MEVCVLGSAGWIPTGTRETSCYAVRQGRSLLLLDGGTGIGRLTGDSGRLLEEVDEIHIIISHFHLDHVVGLTYLNALQLPSNVVIWGPGSHYEQSSRELLNEMTARPYQPTQLGESFEVRDIPSDGLSIRDFDVAFRLQELHAAPSVAMRVNGRLTYCTDTAFDEGNIDFARLTTMLIHESWPASSGPAQGHTAPREAGQLARRGQAELLLLSHIPPYAMEDDLIREARLEFENVAVALEDMTYSV